MYNVQLAEVMTSNVISVSPHDTMDMVGEIFRSNNIHHVPVIDKNGEVVGILSRSDYDKLSHGFTLFKLQKSQEYNNAIMRSLLVEEVMTRQVATLAPEDTVLVAAAFFRENLFHAIPIVEKGKKLVGIVTTYDLLNFAFSQPGLLEEVN